MIKEDIIIIGSGGHAKVCIDILQSLERPIGCCITANIGAEAIYGVPVLCGDHHLLKLRSEGYSKVFVAIGDNETRKRISSACQKDGFELISAISPFSTISKHTTIGMGTIVMPGAIINCDTSIGDGTIINTGATIDHDCIIGSYCHIAPQCALAGSVRVGANTLLGVGSKVLPNVTVGENSIIGAGSLVLRNTPNNSKMYGVPAKHTHDQAKK